MQRKKGRLWLHQLEFLELVKKTERVTGFTSQQISNQKVLLLLQLKCVPPSLPSYFKKNVHLLVQVIYHLAWKMQHLNQQLQVGMQTGVLNQIISMLLFVRRNTFPENISTICPFAPIEQIWALFLISSLNNGDLFDLF